MATPRGARQRARHKEGTQFLSHDFLLGKSPPALLPVRFKMQEKWVRERTPFGGDNIVEIKSAGSKELPQREKLCEGIGVRRKLIATERVA